MTEKKLYNIKAAANLAGLTPFVIRAWEKRYSAIDPDRSDTNRRLYNEDEIEKLKLLSVLTKNGHAISTIADHSADALRSLASGLGSIPKANNDKLTEADQEQIIARLIDESFRAIKQLDAQEFQRVLYNGSIDLSRKVFIRDFLSCLLEEIGHKWQTGEIKVIFEHFASSHIRTFLGQLFLQSKVPPNAPRAVITTPAGQIHELGALMSSLVAIVEGWNALYLGPDLPAEEIAAGVKHFNANVLMLSITYPPDDTRLSQELHTLRSLLTDSVTIIAGGRSRHGYMKQLHSINALVIDEVKDLPKTLARIR